VKPAAAAASKALPPRSSTPMPTCGGDPVGGGDDAEGAVDLGAGGEGSKRDTNVVGESGKIERRENRMMASQCRDRREDSNFNFRISAALFSGSLIPALITAKESRGIEVVLAFESSSTFNSPQYLC
jgi:hypothetical protein